MNKQEDFAGAVPPGASVRESAQLKAILNALPVPIYTTDAEGRVTFFNREAANLAGRVPDLGHDKWCVTWRLYDSDGTPIPHEECPMALALKEQRPVRGIEAVAERPDGTRVPFLPYPTPLFDASGTMVGAVNMLVDLTERRRAGERLDASESRYRNIFEGARVALWDQDFSPLLDRLDALRAAGVADIRAYFEERPQTLAEAVALVQVRDVNNYAVELFEADGKEALLGALGATFLPETRGVFLEEVVALWEGKRGFESEALVRTLKGRRLHILLTIAWAGERCERSLVSILDMSKQKASERRLETLNSIARTLSSDLDLERTVQSVTDIATELTGAKFGAFFYNVTNEEGERYVLYTLSGAPREAFEKFGLPRNTAVFEPTFRGDGIVRSDDIRADPRYGKSAPHFGMPEGHLPVVSYLAVPVVSGSGEVHGGLFFGHDEKGVFTKESEDLVAGIASHAAIAIDNARLLRSAQAEIEKRRRTEESLARRMDEQRALFQFTDRLYRAESLNSVYEAALDAILRALGCERASILLFDAEGAMRFVAWRGLSISYRKAVDGHSPWTPEVEDPRPICIDDIETADLTDELRAAIRAERIGALAFIPLVANGRLIGKFMTYYEAPHSFTEAEIELALTIARQLGFSVERMRAAEAHRLAEESRRESERRLELALTAGQMGAWEWNIGSGRVIWSPGLERIHRLHAGSFGGRFEDFRRDIHPEDVSLVLTKIERAVATASDYHVSYRIRTPDGELRWLEAFGRPVAGSDGRVQKLVGVCMDITERKHGELQRDLLVAELSHRVKNALATVISIAKLSFSKAPSVDEARRSFDHRIRALAQTHGRLAETNWSGVSFETMLLDEFAPYRRGDGDNIRISGPPVTLNPRCALTLGLAVHELATNAAKYGALSDKNGSVDVAWDTDALKRQIRIRWTEAGGPPVAPPARSGFGRLLLERALASDLKGAVDLDFAAGGLRCAIAVPLEECSG